MSDTDAGTGCGLAIGSACFDAASVIASLVLVLSGVIAVSCWFCGRNNNSWRRAGEWWYLDLLEDRVVSRGITLLAIALAFAIAVQSPLGLTFLKPVFVTPRDTFCVSQPTYGHLLVGFSTFNFSSAPPSFLLTNRYAHALDGCTCVLPETLPPPPDWVPATASHVPSDCVFNAVKFEETTDLGGYVRFASYLITPSRTCPRLNPPPVFDVAVSCDCGDGAGAPDPTSTDRQLLRYPTNNCDWSPRVRIMLKERMPNAIEPNSLTAHAWIPERFREFQRLRQLQQQPQLTPTVESQSLVRAWLAALVPNGVSLRSPALAALLPAQQLRTRSNFTFHPPRQPHATWYEPNFAFPTARPAPKANTDAGANRPVSVSGPAPVVPRFGAQSRVESSPAQSQPALSAADSESDPSSGLIPVVTLNVLSALQPVVSVNTTVPWGPVDTTYPPVTTPVSVRVRLECSLLSPFACQSQVNCAHQLVSVTLIPFKKMNLDGNITALTHNGTANVTSSAFVEAVQSLLVRVTAALNGDGLSPQTLLTILNGFNYEPANELMYHFMESALAGWSGQNPSVQSLNIELLQYLAASGENDDLLTQLQAYLASSGDFPPEMHNLSNSSAAASASVSASASLQAFTDADGYASFTLVVDAAHSGLYYFMFGFDQSGSGAPPNAFSASDTFYLHNAIASISSSQAPFLGPNSVTIDVDSPLPSQVSLERGYSPPLNFWATFYDSAGNSIFPFPAPSAGWQYPTELGDRCRVTARPNNAENINPIPGFMQAIGYLTGFGLPASSVYPQYLFGATFMEGSNGYYNVYLRCHGVLSDGLLTTVRIVNRRYPDWSSLAGTAPFWVLSFIGLVLVMPFFWFNAASASIKPQDSSFPLRQLFSLSINAFYGTVVCVAIGALYVYLSKGPSRDAFSAIGYTTVDGLFRTFTGSDLESIFPVSTAVFDGNPANAYNNTILGLMITALCVIAVLFGWNFARFSTVYFRRQFQFLAADEVELNSFAAFLWTTRRDAKPAANSDQFVAVSFATVALRVVASIGVLAVSYMSIASTIDYRRNAVNAYTPRLNVSWVIPALILLDRCFAFPFACALDTSRQYWQLIWCGCMEVAPYAGAIAVQLAFDQFDFVWMYSVNLILIPLLYVAVRAGETADTSDAGARAESKRRAVIAALCCSALALCLPFSRHISTRVSSGETERGGETAEGIAAGWFSIAAYPLAFLIDYLAVYICERQSVGAPYVQFGFRRFAILIAVWVLHIMFYFESDVGVIIIPVMSGIAALLVLAITCKYGVESLVTVLGRELFSSIRTRARDEIRAYFARLRGIDPRTCTLTVVYLLLFIFFVIEFSELPAATVIGHIVIIANVYSVWAVLWAEPAYKYLHRSISAKPKAKGSAVRPLSSGGSRFGDSTPLTAANASHDDRDASPVAATQLTGKGSGPPQHNSEAESGGAFTETAEPVEPAVDEEAVNRGVLLTLQQSELTFVDARLQQYVIYVRDLMAGYRPSEPEPATRSEQCKRCGRDCVNYFRLPAHFYFPQRLMIALLVSNVLAALLLVVLYVICGWVNYYGQTALGYELRAEAMAEYGFTLTAPPDRFYPLPELTDYGVAFRGISFVLGRMEHTKGLHPQIYLQILYVSLSGAAGIAFATVALSSLCIGYRYRDQMLALRRGQYFFARGSYWPTVATRYIGYQIVHLLASFAAVFAFIILVAIVVILLYFVPSFQAWLLDSIVATLLWGLRYVILMLALWVCTDYAFTNLSHPNTVRFRRSWTYVDYFNIFVYLSTGTFYVAARFVSLPILCAISVWRVDKPILPREYEHWEPVYASYVGMAAIDHQHNNPILRVFVQIVVADRIANRKARLQQLQLRRQPKEGAGRMGTIAKRMATASTPLSPSPRVEVFAAASPSPSAVGVDRKIDYDHKSAASAAADDLEMPRDAAFDCSTPTGSVTIHVPLPRTAEAIRFRWPLAVMLYRNPNIRHSRHHHLSQMSRTRGSAVPVPPHARASVALPFATFKPTPTTSS